MKTSKWLRVTGAAVLAITLIGAMTVPAFAQGGGPGNGYYGYCGGWNGTHGPGMMGGYYGWNGTYGSGVGGGYQGYGRGQMMGRYYGR